MADRRLPITEQENFVELVSQYEFLWSPNHPNYRNKQMKDNCWEQIGKQFGLDGNMAFKKWKQLRDRYAIEKKKILESRRSGGGLVPVDPYQPKWCLFKVLDGFLGDRSQAAECIEIYASGEETSVNIPVEAEEPIAGSSSSSSSLSIPATVTGTDVLPDGRLEPQHQQQGMDLFSFNGLKHHHHPQQRNPVVDDYLMGTLRQVSSSLGALASSKDTLPPDMHYHYCMSLAPRLRAMPANVAATLRLKIESLFHKAETVGISASDVVQDMHGNY